MACAIRTRSQKEAPGRRRAADWNSFCVLFRMANIVGVFGIALFIASRDALRIEKRFLFLSRNNDIQRREITAFQFRRHGTREGKTYSLRIAGTKEHLLITRETSDDSASWVGRTLANWFEVPFV